MPNVTMTKAFSWLAVVFGGVCALVLAAAFSPLFFREARGLPPLPAVDERLNVQQTVPPLQDAGAPSALHSTDVPRVVYGRTPQAEWNAVDGFTDREVSSLDDVDELLELIQDANAERPNREGLRSVRVRDLRSGAITTMQMTGLEYLALHHLDQRALYYYRARRATCTDRDGHRYLFWSFPRSGDIARGIHCFIPRARRQYDILAILTEPRYDDLRVHVADAGVTGGATSNETEEEYPVGCAIHQDGTVPPLFLCRRRAAPVHVTPAP